MAQINHLLAKTVQFNINGGGISVGSDQGVSVLEKIISNIFGFLTLVAVLFFVFNIIFAGYSFISSQGDEKKMIEARSRLTNGVLGLAIVILAIGISSLIAKLLGLSNIFSLTTVFNTLKFQ